MNEKKHRFPPKPWEKNKPAIEKSADVPAPEEKASETPETPETPEVVAEENVPENVEPAKGSVSEIVSEKVETESDASAEVADSQTPAPAASAEQDVAEKKQTPPPSPKNAGQIDIAKLAEEFINVRSELFKTKETLKKAEEDLKKARDAYVASIAEFDNFRRRTNEERPKNMIYAKGDLAKDLFPVLDNFKLGIEAAEKHHPEAKEIVDGFEMIAAQIKNALAQHGISEINPVGKPFDPNEHESLSVMPSADAPEDSVLFVHRVGYKIGDRLLRPASVVIAGKAE